MKWQEKVKKLMNDRNINQKQLSKLSGVTASSVSRYLKSERRPRIDIIVNFAKALDVDMEYLLDDDDDESKNSAYNSISTVIARKGGNLTPEEKNKLIRLLLGEK